MTLIEVMKPYLWLASVAFLAGFVSYVALGPSSPAVAREVAAPASGPAVQAAAMAGAWNIPKRI
jgi:hypothetical protein